MSEVPIDVEALLDRFRAAWSPERWRETTVVAAVSGGADSVALLWLLQATAVGRGRLVVAHMNHHWRAEAIDDERFVCELAERLGVTAVVGHAVLTGDEAERTEEAARDARYRFLQTTAERLGARYLLTAHTADDQAETVLHHVVRGTGISGLAGMGRTRQLSGAVTLVRPLLEFRRAELHAYLRTIGQTWRYDRSNDDTNYTRNRIRHELLPQLAEGFNAQVVEALARLGRLAGEAQGVIAEIVEPLVEGIPAAVDGEIVIDCRPLSAAQRYVVREVFVELWRRRDWPRQAMGFAHWEALAELAQQKTPGPQAPDEARRTGSVNLPGGFRGYRAGEELHIVLPRPPR